MKTINNLLKTVTLLSLSLLCASYSARAQSMTLPQIKGIETLKIADAASPLATFSASGIYKITAFRAAAPSMVNYTNSIKAKGTIYYAIINGINHGGTNVQYGLIWTNTTGNVTSAQNADLAASVTEQGDSATITIKSKRTDLTILGVDAVSYLSYLGNKSYIADFVSQTKGSVNFLCVQPAGNGIIFFGSVEGSTRRINLPGGKAVVKSKAIGFKY